MSFTRLNRRLTAWIATFAILLGALAPTISHAVAWVSGEDIRWVEVCTVAGVKLVVADAASASGEEGQGDDGALVAERCPYCGTHAGSFGLPAAPAVSFSLPVTPDLQPTLCHHAPRPLFAWAASHARAPPVRS